MCTHCRIIGLSGFSDIVFGIYRVKDKDNRIEQCELEKKRVRGRCIIAGSIFKWALNEWRLTIPVKYVRYLGARTAAAAGADAKLKTRQTLNWTETSIKAGKGASARWNILEVTYTSTF